VAVVVPAAGERASGPLASPELATAVRAVAAPTPIAAVLISPRLPTDIRHASKIDRAAVARWAGRTLAGQRPGRL
jgi:olefin beta-lactone synthetase